MFDLSKTLVYEFQQYYKQDKYENKARLCYVDTDSFLYEIEAKDFHKDIAKDVKKRFDISEYLGNNNSSLPIGNKTEVVGLMEKSRAIFFG